MKAKELIKQLNKLVKEHGDKDILLVDSESSWYDSIKDITVVQNNQYVHRSGFLLNRDCNY